MTIDELQDISKKYGYHVDIHKNNTWYLIKNQQQQVISQIHKATRYEFMVKDCVAVSFLTKGLWHFAATPINERIADGEAKVHLSKKDLANLAHLPVNNITKDYHLKVPADHLHALRNLRKQLNQKN